MSFGAAKSQQPERNLAVAEIFSARLTILPLDERAAGHYGNIRANLESQGRPVGPCDFVAPGRPVVGVWFPSRITGGISTGYWG
ncbi:MAG: type II toxin-antitoxin system VapC family toxin [Alphaproteobacteria bacterium]